MRKKRPVEYVPYESVKDITFRDAYALRRYTSSQNKILPRRKTGLTAKGQRHVAREIKVAREMGILSYRGQ